MSAAVNIADVIANAKSISQFFDRDALPAMANNVLIPALQNSLMLTLHVSFAVVAYGAACVSFGAAVLYLLQPSIRRVKLPRLEVLDDIGAVWGSQSARTRADSALRSGRWALPDGIPAPALDLLTLAGTVATIAELAATEPDPSLVATTGERRAAALARLAAEADQALEVATNVAALQLRA